MAILFAYTPANTDGVSHFHSIYNNLFGLGDIVGGSNRDSANLVIGFNSNWV